MFIRWCDWFRILSFWFIFYWSVGWELLCIWFLFHLIRLHFNQTVCCYFFFACARVLFTFLLAKIVKKQFYVIFREHWKLERLAIALQSSNTYFCYSGWNKIGMEKHDEESKECKKNDSMLWIWMLLSIYSQQHSTHDYLIRYHVCDHEASHFCLFFGLFSDKNVKFSVYNLIGICIARLWRARRRAEEKRPREREW